MEVLDAAFQQITATLASQLMDEVMKLSSKEFEKLVVSLLLHITSFAVCNSPSSIARKNPPKNSKNFGTAIVDPPRLFIVFAKAGVSGDDLGAPFYL